MTEHSDKSPGEVWSGLCQSEGSDPKVRLEEEYWGSGNVCEWPEGRLGVGDSSAKPREGSGPPLEGGRVRSKQSIFRMASTRTRSFWGESEAEVRSPPRFRSPGASNAEAGAPCSADRPVLWAGSRNLHF